MKFPPKLLRRVGLANVVVNQISDHSDRLPDTVKVFVSSLKDVSHDDTSVVGESFDGAVKALLHYRFGNEHPDLDVDLEVHEGAFTGNVTVWGSSNH